jgi:putative endonuclease
MYWVYILKNQEGIYYKGYTTDLNKRLDEHNSGLSRYTSNKGPWFIVYFKIFENKKDALIEEKRIKRLNVKSIENLISVD